ncbi:MAG: ThuA domain-containing protein, partial [bacterium]
MKQLSNVMLFVILVFWCLLPFANARTQDILPEELQEIKNAVPDKATVTPKRPRKLLIFTLSQGYKHSSIPYATQALEIMGKKTGAFEAVLSNDMSVFQPGNLRQFDAICFNNTTALKFDDPKLRESLLDFVTSGKGIVGIHAASDNFYTWPEAAEMMGGQFDGHPWHANGTWAVKIDEPTHPLTAAFGGQGFKINDEIYRQRTPYSRGMLRVLASLDMTDETTRNAEGIRPTDTDIPISWVRSYGKGRVFYCVLGHNHSIFWNPAVLQHY